MTEKTPVCHVLFAVVLVPMLALLSAIGCNCTQSVTELDGFYEGDVVCYKDNEDARFTIIGLDRASRQANLAYTGRDGARGESWREISTLKKVGEELNNEAINLNSYSVILGEKRVNFTKVQGDVYLDPQQVQFIPHPHTVVALVSQEKNNSWKEGDLVQFRVDAARTMVLSRVGNEYNNNTCQCSWQMPDGSVQRQEFNRFELERVNSFEDDADLLAYNLQN